MKLESSAKEKKRRKNSMFWLQIELCRMQKMKIEIRLSNLERLLIEEI